PSGEAGHSSSSTGSTSASMLSGTITRSSGTSTSALMTGTRNTLSGRLTEKPTATSSRYRLGAYFLVIFTAPLRSKTTKNLVFIFLSCRFEGSVEYRCGRFVRLFRFVGERHGQS